MQTTTSIRSAVALVALLLSSLAVGTNTTTTPSVSSNNNTSPSSLSAASDRTWIEGIYNASGTISLSGYNLSSPTYDVAHWTLEERVSVDAAGNGVLESFGFYNDRREPGSKARGNWTICQAVFKINDNRPSTSAVDPGCKGALSQTCLDLLKSTMTKVRACDFQKDEILKTCGATDVFTKYVSTHNSSNSVYAGSIRGIFRGPETAVFPKANTTDAFLAAYDDVVRDIWAATVSWALEDEKNPSNWTYMDPSIGCLGIDYVKRGSRGLQTAISDAPPAALGLSWALWGIALLMAL